MKGRGFMEMAVERRIQMGLPILPKHIAQVEAAKASRLAALADVVVPERRPQFVYFVGAGDSGPVKIGVAMSIEARLMALQVSHYEPLTVLATCPGSIKLEREYHRRFADARLLGEWFTRTPEIEAEIARLNQMEQAA